VASDDASETPGLAKRLRHKFSPPGHSEQRPEHAPPQDLKRRDPIDGVPGNRACAPEHVRRDTGNASATVVPCFSPSRFSRLARSVLRAKARYIFGASRSLRHFEFAAEKRNEQCIGLRLGFVIASDHITVLDAALHLVAARHADQNSIYTRRFDRDVNNRLAVD